MNNKVRAFQVYLNGKSCCVAGIGDDGVLHAIVDYGAKPGGDGVNVYVGGLISPAGEHVRWMQRDLSVGDEVVVRVVETEKVDEPEDRQRQDPGKQRRAELEHLRRVAKSLNLKLVRRRKRAKKK